MYSNHTKRLLHLTSCFSLHVIPIILFLTGYNNLRSPQAQQSISDMALVPLFQKTVAASFPISINYFKHSSQSTKITQMTIQCHTITRREITNILAASVGVLAMEAISGEQTANALDFRMTTPEQTLEEAENGIKGHAQSLLQVKDLLDAESWKAAQKALRKSSAFLKQDIYTIIQAKPGSERSELRKMYSNLFNSVSRLDYAARDKDVPVIWNCYDNVVVALNNILSRL